VNRLLRDEGNDTMNVQKYGEDSDGGRLPKQTPGFASQGCIVQGRRRVEVSSWRLTMG
jgi:hypothetical protein